ncbi:unnamed protein product [Somion occarium]|uniref:N2227-domain-containing protein n=1 Tax=Somion occarium TaxID=3059160 RepID=A0ABP1DXV6_9APHY
MRASYSRLGWVHKNIGYKLGYPEKLKRAEDVTKLNAKGPYVPTDLSRVQESLKHFVRDWSDEGRRERDRICEPILSVLRDVPVERRASMKVLVPGSGLGRLAWEISELGFNTTAIEFSYFMTLGMHFLFSPQTTQTSNQHTIYPYANWFSHTRHNEDLFRGISFPDVLPRFKPNLRLIEDDFLEHRGETYDFVATLFFVDTSLNIISTLSHIHKLLNSGATWINLGPLLWTSGGRTRLELSLDEVLKLAQMVGFNINGEEAAHDEDFNGKVVSKLSQAALEKRKRRTVECEYTADRLAMMKWLYQAEFWVATKIDR